MSELLQAGQHPDADQLNAFVEHTLPAHQQEQTLAHLAICPDCRQIVALSLPPKEESPILQPQAARPRWLPWAAIPALAALMLAILFVRKEERTVRETPALPQMADAHKPAPPPAPIAPPEALRSPTPLRQRAPQTRAATPATRATPLPPVTQQPASGVMGGILGGIGSGPAQPPTPLTEPSRSFAPPSASEPVMALAGRAQSVLAALGPLPSHLPVLSMASHANQRVAIDSDHHLFFSDDEGRDWKAVPSRWKGRAVSVALTSASSFGSVAPALRMNFHPAGTTVSTLSGTITDPSGAVVPGATVTATNSSGALEGSAITDGHGQYRMEALAPGSYRIVVQARGFDTRSFSTEVAPSQQAVADAMLRVGSASQTVAVEASPGPADTSSAGVNHPPQRIAAQTLSRFELTTDDGERWISTDGQTWTHE
jgi:Carboxypeptidase regulatory-like domain/Putative zinc-finger